MGTRKWQKPYEDEKLNCAKTSVPI